MVKLGSFIPGDDMYTKIADFDFKALLVAKKNTIITARPGIGVFAHLQTAADELSLNLGELRCGHIDLLGMPNIVKSFSEQKYDILYLSDYDCVPEYLYGPLMNDIKIIMGEPFIIAGTTSTATIRSEWLKYFPESATLIY